jgi:hypothetical protein
MLGAGRSLVRSLHDSDQPTFSPQLVELAKRYRSI